MASTLRTTKNVQETSEALRSETPRILERVDRVAVEIRLRMGGRITLVGDVAPVSVPLTVALAVLLADCTFTSPTEVLKVLVTVLANLLVALLLVACAAMVLLFRLKAESVTVPAFSRTA